MKLEVETVQSLAGTEKSWVEQLAVGQTLVAETEAFPALGVASASLVEASDWVAASL